jgi:hypothetical protein
VRKVKAKKLRQLAGQLYDPGVPENNRKRIYRSLKAFYKSGYLPKDLKISGAE